MSRLICMIFVCRSECIFSRPIVGSDKLCDRELTVDSFYMAGLLN
jgi:hypothetical protein